MPKYVKVLSGFFVEKGEVGKIYDTSKAFPTHLQGCKDRTWKKQFENDIFFQYFKEVENLECITNNYEIY